MARAGVTLGLVIAGLLAIGVPASAQPAVPLERIAKSEARADFDVAAAQFNIVEYPGASTSVRSRTPLTIRFQMEETYLDTKWMSLLGFSLVGDNQADEVQIDFVEAPGRNALLMAATRIYRTAKSRDNLGMVAVPKFQKRDVHEIRLEVTVDTVTVVIDGQRRPLPLDFPATHILTRASGVRGWVQFVEQPPGQGGG